MSAPHRYQSHLFQSVQAQVRRIHDQSQRQWRQLKIAVRWGTQVALSPLLGLMQGQLWERTALGAETPPPKRSLQRIIRQSLNMLLPLRQKGLGQRTASISTPVLFERVLGDLALQVRPEAKPRFLSMNAEAREAAAPDQMWRVKIQSRFAPRAVFQSWGRQALMQVRSWLGRSPRSAQPSCPTSSPLQSNPTMASSETELPVQVVPVIRGIASCCEGHQLVLVTVENQVLDILTAAQQRLLKQRIDRELGIYLRSDPSALAKTAGSTLRQHQSLRLAIAQPISVALAPCRVLQGWMQRVYTLAWTRVMTAIAPTRPQALPFKATPLPSPFTPWARLWAIVRHHLPGALMRRLPEATPPRRNVLGNCLALGTLFKASLLRHIEQRRFRQWLIASLGTLALLPFTLALPRPAQAIALPVSLPRLPTPMPMPEWSTDIIYTRRRRWQWRQLFSRDGGYSQGKVRIAAESKAIATAAFSADLANWAAQASRVGSPRTQATTAVIDTPATVLGYEQSPLEQVLHWLDRLFARFEMQLMALWHYLQRILATTFKA